MNNAHWSLPGGRVKVAEESQLGLQREFQEELGVNVKVERMIWSVENFFNHNGKDFHEIGFYYKVSLNDTYFFSTDSFYGIEGEKLIYKWASTEELNEVTLYPEFLKEKLKDIPNHSEHIVIKQ